MGSQSTSHESRRQWLASSCIRVLAACPACRANGHGRRTEAGCGSLLLAVALQCVIAHRRCQGTRPRAVLHLPRITALVVGHLVRVQVAGFTSQKGQTFCHIARKQARGDSAGDAFISGSRGSDTSPIGMHDSPEKRTGPSEQSGRRGSGAGRRGHGFRVNTTRQPRHEFLEATAVVRPLMYMGAGNVPSVRRKWAREGYREGQGRRSHRPNPRILHHKTP